MQHTTLRLLGVTKVNIDTDGRLVWMGVHREHLRENPRHFDIRKPGEEYIKTYADIIMNKTKALLSAGTLSQARAALSRGA